MKFYTNVQVGYDSILYRGVSGDKRIMQKVPYKPSLFVPVKKETPFQTLEGKFVERVQFENIKEAREWAKEQEELANSGYYGNKGFQYTFIADKFPQEKIDYDVSKIVVANIDIETASENGFAKPENANEEIIAITIECQDKFYVFGCGEFTPDPKRPIYYFKCQNEVELLSKFLDRWEEILPDVVSGWNIGLYDLPYIINRLTRVLGEKEAKRVSPWKKFSERTVLLMGRPHQVFDIVGIAVLDYLEMYKKFPPPGINPENYRLNTIAQLDLGKGKVSYDDYDGLHDLYKKNFQKFIEYNIRDVEIVDELEDKHKLIEMCFSIAYDAKVNYNDVFTQVRLWDAIAYNTLKEMKIAVPQKKYHTKDVAYAGAFVKEPQRGLHKWVVNFDLNSLYPNLIRMFNISPETLVPGFFKNVQLDDLLHQRYKLDYLKEEHLTMAANGHHFKMDKEGFLGFIMRRMYQDRITYKNKMIEAEKELEKVSAELKRRGA